jgi:2-methylcitrate synthase
LHVKAMHVSLILYAEHEFNASTFTAACRPTLSDMYSRIAAIGCCAARSTAAPTKWRSK